jgi:hypothetical protein
MTPIELTIDELLKIISKYIKERDNISLDPKKLQLWKVYAGYYIVETDDYLEVY